MQQTLRNSVGTRWLRSLPPRPPRWAEGGLVLAALLALAAVVYGSHVANGTFSSDDWANQSVYHHADDPRFANTFDRFWTTLGGRPLLALSLALPHALLGADPQAHLVLGVVLAVLACVAFYALLRELGIPALHAAAVGALALVFPWADSTRLWATAGINNVAVLFYLVGVVVALRGLRRTPRLVTAHQAVAVVLVVCSVLTYEAAAVLALASGLLYVRVVPWRLAARRWLVDLAFVGAAIVWSMERTAPLRGGNRIRGSIRHLDEYTADALSILELSFRPFGMPAWLLAAAVVAVVAGGVVLRRRTHVPAAARQRVAFWAVVGMGAAVAVGMAYASFMSSELFPKRSGIYNRGNLLAALPFALLVYALAMVAGTLLFATAQRWRQWSLAFSLILVAAVAAGYLDRLLDDKAQWRTAASMQNRALETLRAAVPELPSGSTVYTFNYPAQVSPGIPIFSDTWDLRGAVRLGWNDKSLGAYPIFGGTRFVCGSRGVHPEGGKQWYFLEGGYGREQGGAYGKVFAVDLQTRETHRIDDARDCESVLPAMKPGPSYLLGPQT